MSYNYYNTAIIHPEHEKFTHTKIWLPIIDQVIFSNYLAYRAAEAYNIL